ncbi:MAG TPA: type II secretion system major pseudopilin GspG [Verrucomicrobiae bacterium]|nr:type II secretion system major pseudopilin GspG [Verrucomicrobiae bacterium]
MNTAIVRSQQLPQQISVQSDTSSNFGFRNSAFLRPSAFGLRASPRRTVRRQAFTLVEMLLVLVILATLAAIVYPKVMGRSEQARVTAAQQQVANFKIALDAFEVDTGYYPKGRNGLGDLIIQPRDVTGWHGPYLESIPKDPWGNDYIYECPGKHNPSSYDISSPGPPGGQSPIGNWQNQK